MSTGIMTQIQFWWETLYHCICTHSGSGNCSSFSQLDVTATLAEQNKAKEDITEQDRAGQDRAGQDRAHHSIAHSTAQHNTAQHSTAQHRTAQNRTEELIINTNIQELLFATIIILLILLLFQKFKVVFPLQRTSSNKTACVV